MRKKVISVLACAVIFCTVYLLILPAITLEKTPTCGKTEHVHSVDCYVQLTDETACTPESLDLHQHTSDCVDENGEYACGYADFVVHQHDDACYDADGNLWCLLPEIELHTHSEECYAESEPVEEAHVHTDACYRVEQGELICTESIEPHTHTEACYSETEALVCELPEGEGHQHEASCYDEAGEVICGCEESEGHQHDEGCYVVSSELTCALNEAESHQHTDECYAQNKTLICEFSADADGRELICGQEEIILHEHTDDCFDESGKPICGQRQVLEHVHSEACMQSAVEIADPETLTCTISEGEGAHTHGEGCYDEAGKLICALEENEGHQHGPLCYGTWKLICDTEEHTHTEKCYIETEIPDVILGGNVVAGLDQETSDAAVESEAPGALTMELEQYITSVTLQYQRTAEDDWADMASNTVEQDSRLRFMVHYTLPAGLLSTENSTLTWQMPQALPCKAHAETIYDVQNKAVGQYVLLEDGRAMLHFTEAYIKASQMGSAITGVLKLEVNAADLVTEGNQFTVSFTEQINLTVTITALQDQKLTAAIYTDSTYQTLAEDATVITVSGNLPVDAQVKAYPVAVQLPEQTVLCAYDIAVYTADGALYEPKADQPLQVNMQSSQLALEEAAQTAAVYYVPESGQAENVESTVTNGSATFTAPHFSVYAVATPCDGMPALTQQTITVKTVYKDNTWAEELKRDDHKTDFIVSGLLPDQATIKVYQANTVANQFSEREVRCAYGIVVFDANGNEYEASDVQVTIQGDELKLLVDNKPHAVYCVLENGDVKSMYATIKEKNATFKASLPAVYVIATAPKGTVEPSVYGNNEITFKSNKQRDAFTSDPQYAKYYNQNSPLGVAGSFHIVAFDTATLNAHTNGNILAKKLVAGSNFGTKDEVENGGIKEHILDELTYVQEYEKVNDGSGFDAADILVVGAKNSIGFADGGAHFCINDMKFSTPYNLLQDKDTATAPFIDLVKVESDINSLSGTLRGTPMQNIETSFTNQNNRYIKLIDSSSVGVYDMTAAELNRYNSNPLEIKGFQTGCKGSIIINVDCSGVSEINMPRAQIWIDGVQQSANEVKEFSTGKVIWNFINEENTIINTNVMTGMVVAPSAIVNIKQNLNGTVVAKNVTITAESHRTDFTGVAPAYLYISKVDGDDNTPLQGAKFALYQWEQSAGEYIKLPNSYVSDQNGRFVMQGLQYNTAYQLVEVEAPEGYALKEDRYLFCFPHKNTEQYPICKPEGFDANAEKVENNATKVICNEKISDYTLPEAGGSGTQWYTIVGLLLIIAALWLYCRQKTARKRV